MTIGEQFGIPTEGTPEYTTLLNRHLAEELGRNTNQIVTALGEETNPVPKEEITEKMEEVDGALVNIETDPEGRFLRANVLTRENNRVFFLDMSTNPKGIYTVITQKTFDTLASYAIDPMGAMQLAQDSLEDAI